METRYIIQVPASPLLKLAAEKTAKEQGFSSLQEAIRIFMTQLAKKTISVSFSQSATSEILNSRQESILTKKYLKTKREITKGKGFTAKTVSEMMKDLRARP